MKIRDLEKILVDNGFKLIRSSKHMIYSNGFNIIPIPHQKECNKMLAKRIVKEIKRVKGDNNEHVKN